MDFSHLPWWAQQVVTWASLAAVLYKQWGHGRWLQALDQQATVTGQAVQNLSNGALRCPDCGATVQSVLTDQPFTAPAGRAVTMGRRRSS